MTNEIYDPNRSYAAPAGAQLTYRGGPLLSAPKLFGVFVDDPSGSAFPYKAEMSAYLDWYGSSDLLSELKEYNVSGSGTHIGDARIQLGGSTPPPPPPPPVPGPPPPQGQCQAELDALVNCLGYAAPSTGGHHHKHRGSLGLPHRVARLAGVVVQDADLQKLLSDSISAGSLPKPDSETLYVMFLPDGVTVQLGQDASCQTFCGYHSNFSLSDGSNVFYAILPFPSCSGCMGSLATPLDSLTAITSHEISEAVTDPIPGNGWYDDANGEIGDICAWQTRQDGSYTVQLEWSNSHNACI